MSIPSAWSMTSIGDLFDVGAGKTVNAEARTTEPKHPFLRTANVFWGRLDLGEVDRMHFTSHDLTTKTLQRGDLLVCEGGDIGRAAIWNGQIPQCGFQNHLHRLRPKRAGVVPTFFMYALQAGFTLHARYEGAGNKTTIPNLSRSRLEALDVPEPPPIEQARIAAVLTLIHRAIETEEKSIATTRELKQAAFDQLLSRGLCRQSTKETVIGPVPATWTVAKLGDLCGLATGTTPSTKREDYYVGDVPFIKTGDIVNNRITSANAFVSREAVSDYGLKVFPPGTVLMAMYGQGKTRGQVSLLEIGAATTQNAAAIQPSGELEPRFLWHYLMSQYQQLRGIGSLGHLSHLNLGYLRERLILKPPLDEQREIATMFDAIELTLDWHRRKYAIACELFSSLLDKLMTGEIRVDNLDIDTSEVAPA